LSSEESEGVETGFQEENEIIKCVVCKKGETKAGKTTVTLERDGATLVFKGVPARVCANCGEEYVDGDITARFLKPAEGAARSGIQVEIRQYIPA
jgi:YgiT-type zinc finger domain-containing protein